MPLITKPCLHCSRTTLDSWDLYMDRGNYICCKKHLKTMSVIGSDINLSQLVCVECTNPPKSNIPTLEELLV